MTAPRSPAPTSVRVRSALGGGDYLTVTATRRDRAGRAELKCSAPAAPWLAARMAEVALLARHTQADADSAEQVVLSIDRAPGPGAPRDWELALVLADCAVRGALALPAGPDPVVANGWSDQWQLARIDGHDVPGLAPTVLRGGPQNLHHLGALTGQPDLAPCVAQARAWFPLHSGGLHDALAWVDVSVFPLAPSAAGAPDEDPLAAPGLDSARLAQLRQVLHGARHFDGERVGRWRTLLRWSTPHFEGNSYELALVMADRLARGREFVPRARIIASGCSDAWHAGLVQAVAALEAKCALIAREAQTGDRVLLPRAWAATADPALAAALRARGASLAWIERIGII